VHRYINFGVLCLQFLVLSRLYAELVDPDSADNFDASISIIEVLMIFLTYGLFLSFGGVAIKKAVVKARSVDAADLGAKISSFFSRKSSGGTLSTATTNAESELPQINRRAPNEVELTSTLKPMDGTL